MKLHTTPKALVDCLHEAGIPYKIVSHWRSESASGEAVALGIDPHEVAKTIVLSTPDGFVRAVVQATDRIDLHKVREMVGSHVALATEEELAGAYPEYELGAVPPIADGHADRIVIDERLRDHLVVYFEGGTHEQSLLVRMTDLIDQDGATVAAISE
jgi:Ala-tRNA(Pro) deacylase